MKFLLLIILLAVLANLRQFSREGVEARRRKGEFLGDLNPEFVFKQMINEKRANYPVRQEEEAKKFVYILSPISDQIIDIGRQFKPEMNAFNDNSYTRTTTAKPKGEFKADLSREVDECHTIRTTMELVKEELVEEKSNLGISLRRRRSCKGLVQVNKCEGWCASSIWPSIKTQTGFRKNCLCCNEGSLRLIQVRLNECFWSQNDEDEGNPPASFQRIAKDEPNSFMDVTIEEPSECKCRKCEVAF